MILTIDITSIRYPTALSLVKGLDVSKRDAGKCSLLLSSQCSRNKGKAEIERAQPAV